MRELAQTRFGLTEVMRHVAEREHHGVQPADRVAVAEFDLLQAVRGVANVDRDGLVRDEADR